MHRQHVARLDDVVAVEQLAGAGVAADVHERVALVDDAGTPAGQAVDDPVDGVLVAGDQARGEQDGVVLLDVHEVVAALRDPAQRAHRLALAPGRDQHLPLRRQVGELLGLDHHPRRHREVAEVAGDAHVAHHRAADVGDLAVVGDGGVEHLLHPVHVGGEAGHDDPLLGVAEDLVDDGGDRLLGGREAGRLGVGRVGEEEVDTLLAEAREGPQVGDPAVERQLVHLEVAGVEHQARRRPDRDRERVGDGVVDRDELELERPERHRVALAHLVVDGLAQPVLAQLAVEQGQGQLGAHQRDVLPFAQQVRRGADVVLVAVGEHQGLDVAEPVSNGREVGEDQVDAGVVVLGEQDPAVDDEQPAGVLEDGHVAPDLAEPAERDDPERSLRQLGRYGQLGMRVAQGVSYRVDVTGRSRGDRRSRGRRAGPPPRRRPAAPGGRGRCGCRGRRAAAAPPSRSWPRSWRCP